VKLALSFLTLLMTFSIARADDIADAKAAFATMLEYQKTDDARTLDLFTPDCPFTVTLTDGKASRTVVVPPELFRKQLTVSIAKKEGNKDIYENVNYAPEAGGVRVTATVLAADTGKRGPFSVLYVRNNGTLKIKEIKVTAFVPAIPPQQ